MGRRGKEDDGTRAEAEEERWEQRDS